MKIDSPTDGFVAYHRYGKTYYRRRPDKYRDACTPVQQLQRGRMPAVVAFYQNLKDSFIARIWRAAALQNGCSGYNLFVKYNINAFEQNGEVADYSKLTLSEGTLPLPEHIRIEKTGEREVTVRWDDLLPVSISRKSDRLFAAVIYSSNPFEVHLLATEDTCRGDLCTTLMLDNSPEDTVHLYLFFGSEKPESYSAQQYFSIH
ncbi:DUF6266 family protein [Odoribacter lunatus]|uniref:DUF6266 family protein n=1 Tax=Odoribacter lunatus TaxID=2941335 RepID=UPI00203B32D3|nr:DUF6266 family protein [Odoribacter lunatus]